MLVVLDGQRHRRAGDRRLGVVARLATAPRDGLDDVAVAVARGEVHRRIDRVARQDGLDHARRLDEVAPVGGAEVAQAADAVADRDLVGGLALARQVKHVLQGLPVAGEALLEPRHRELQRRTLRLQAARELGHERRGQWLVRLDDVGQHQHDALGIDRARRDHRVDPVACSLTLVATGRHPRDDAPQVLEQGQAQHDRDRPQLAELERLRRLIRAHVSQERVPIDAPMRVRDELQRQLVDPRRARHAPVREARQLAAVGPRQVPARDPDLLVDDVVVVDEPLGRGRELPTSHQRRREQRVRRPKHEVVGAQPGQQPIGCRPRPRDELVPQRHRARMPLELRDAEELGLERSFVGRQSSRLATGDPRAHAPPARQLATARVQAVIAVGLVAP